MNLCLEAMQAGGSSKFSPFVQQRPLDYSLIALYQDLLTRGQIDLTSLVRQDCFTISGSQLTFPPALDETETWKQRTALLFLQQAHHVSRRILREDAHDHPRAFPHFRFQPFSPLSPSP
ncbi:MAG: hypothetical protein ABSA23_15015 [Anaerolineales bacterium]